MTDAPIFDANTIADQPNGLFLDVSKLPDRIEPPTLDISNLPDLPDELKPDRASTEDPYNAAIGAPHDEDAYKELLDNATSDADLLYSLCGKTVVDAIKRLYAPDTSSPKALAAAQNAIAVSELTGFKVSPAAYLENPDAYNESLFGTGHLREKVFMGLAGMVPMIAEGAPTSATAEGAVDTAGAIADAWRAWRSGLWRMPLGIAGYEAEEKANALIRSYIEGKPFSQTKPYGLHDLEPEDAGEGTKAVVDLLDMFGKSKAMHAGFGGLETLWDAMAYDKVSQVLPSRKLYISADDIRSHFGAGTEENPGDYYDILQKLSLSPAQVKDAAKYGLDVEVPLSAVLTSSDAPWFAGLKNFLRISPYSEVTEFPGGKPEARLHVSGELEAPTVGQGVGAEPPTKIPEQSLDETAVSSAKPTPLESEKPSVAPESTASYPAVQGQRLKNSNDYLQGPDFAKEWIPSRNDYDALVPFINAASEEYDVPANIVKAVVWRGLNNDPDIVYGKSAGASGSPGAMQPIPDTDGAPGARAVSDPERNIDGSTRYLRTLYERFGDWEKAVAAYDSAAASRFFAKNPEAKVEDAPNYSAYVKPVLDAAEKFVTGTETALDIAGTDVWERRKRGTLKDRPGRLVAGTQKPMVGEQQGQYVKLSETPEFKNWFGDSKVIYKDGESDAFQNPEGTPGIPRMVYHGTYEKRSSDLFRPNEQGVIVFSSTQERALDDVGKEAEIIPAYLKMENPLEMKSEMKWLDTPSMDAAIAKAKAQGNDGIIIDHWKGTDCTYLVFSPDQVKSPLCRDIFDIGDTDVKNEAGRSYGEESIDAGGSGYTTTAQEFQQIEKKPVEVINLPVESHADFAVIAQAWRNPNYEELRYVYARQGIIVDHEGVTCRLPMTSRAFLGDRAEGIKHIKERIAALGADAFWAVHNHGSGGLEPSANDLDLTVSLANEIPEMKGHIIINSGKYAFIDPKGNYKIHRLPNLPKKWIDPILTPSVPHWMLKQRYKPPWDIAAWTKALTRERNRPLIVYLNPQFRVRGLQEINPEGNRDWRQLAEAMPKKLVDFGSAHAVLILPERSSGYMHEIGETLVRRGVFYDVVSVDEGGPHSILEIGTSAPDRVFGGRPLSDFPPEAIR
jgi:hypothetical protein